MNGIVGSKPVNEDVVLLTSGARTKSENAAYEYARIERNHRHRYLFEPMRLLRDIEQINSYAADKNPFPKSVEIDPANTCNHDCPFCIYHSLHHEGHREQLPHQRLLNLIDELAAGGCKSILFVGGGEPMTHRGTVDAIEKAFAHGIAAGLVTNGSLVRPPIASRLKVAATYVRFSLDAADADTHRKMHMKDDFAIIIENLKSLVAAKGMSTVGTGFFINSGNWHQILDYARLMKSIGVDYVQFKSYSGIPIPTEWYFEMLDLLVKTFGLSDNSFDIHVMDRIFDNSTHQARTYGKCHWQAFKPVIGADGSIFLCAQKRTTPAGAVGNILYQTFNEVWNSQKRREVVGALDLKACPYCVHHKQNQMLEYLRYDAKTHPTFF